MLAVTNAFTGIQSDCVIYVSYSADHSILYGGVTAMIKTETYSPDDTIIQVVYDLATPQTISLTPTEVETIKGYNNVYADSGSVDVVYYRNLDIVINRLLEGSAS